mmetsp:Transcript_22311/g.75436  ORF Transcript_22311/g.75436 Transcript_22311/m.75436 type:complete len:663 (+) Transcript_22311:191-2179(+)|eukprot:CAMPEP_0184130314 /NCGR_PEP_ID=MMETSP0974-20121125/27537_1 /TAXON_ID=483370 /ORGANISM="non described non described, Strain CCMP2097" /LENGTH=662 /DNA_ID=CAMNT_0026433775 /DNA_START=106 /DNA_END=2094 /DNA_ORIENTATION=-
MSRSGGGHGREPSHLGASLRRGTLSVSAHTMSPTRLMSALSKLRRPRSPPEDLPLLTHRPRSFHGTPTDDGASETIRESKPLLLPSVVQKAVKPQDGVQWGLYAQYFAVGVVYGGLPATIYGLFLGYFNVESYVYGTAGTIISLPWSFKFIFGAINDCIPIYGYRRKSYMVLGWALCAFALVCLWARELPPPYWCVGKEGYVKTRSVENDDGSFSLHVAHPCNAAAATSGAPYALLMMLASCGYCIADVAADGLTVTMARHEKVGSKGQTQTSVYLMRTMGNIVSVCFVGLGMNSWEYNGSFDWGLSFNAMCAVFSVPALVMIPVSWYFVYEEPILPKYAFRRAALGPQQSPAYPKYVRQPGSWGTDSPASGLPAITPNLTARIVRQVSFSQYAKGVWGLLRSKAMLHVLLYQLLTPVIGGIFTTGSAEVKQHWAGVKNLQSSIFSLVGLVLFTLGLWLVKAKFLDKSWRVMLLSTTLFLNVLDMPFSFLTIFGVVRNQYFYLGEAVLSEVPAAINFVVSTFVIVEMADGGDEGLVYGLLTTTNNLGAPVAQAISNQLFGLFRPSLSNSQNYLDDTLSFRKLVALSFAISYGATFVSLAFLPLLPDQRADAQHRKRTWGKSDGYAMISITLVTLGLLYSVTCSFLTIYPATMCLRFVGGEGC